MLTGDPDSTFVGAGAMGARSLSFSSIPVIDIAPLFGISHHPAERASPADLAAGCRVLAGALLALAGGDHR